MKHENGWYIDENNNRWSDSLETEASAKRKSESLTNCEDCSGCSGCSRCSGCFGCSRCSRCSRCSGCFDCSGCSRCSGCFDCFDCSGCSRCSRCSRCSGCFDCSGCSGCSDCSDFKENPQRFTSGRIGSRRAQTTVYWLTREDVQVICGCFKGDLDGFEGAVTDKHKGTVYEQQYLKLIETVKYLVAQEI